MYLSTAQNIGLAILAHRLGIHVADCTNHQATFCIVVDHCNNSGYSSGIFSIGIPLFRSLYRSDCADSGISL